ncbi:hypothetical protein M6B22_18305 [Jatrophihabitans cynanchi]|jgi:hypothetical protein|uniref:Uncharacterized protein n=1 Tax=Jatrophihabitans cynanchi TaxID=2944128 RepID=A0ABY7JV95_9ACTN|nr:hypothetical protein [Jatrophihabitans sp. SB3-54]WAX56468.1 hypothetical protein M6B22_18305 [Jatrophihabitans sp. SB3-54]
MPQDHVHPGRTSDLNSDQEQLQGLFEEPLGHTGSRREAEFATLSFGTHIGLRP